MVALDGLMDGVSDLVIIDFLGVGKQILDILMQRALVTFERNHIITLLLGNQLDNLGLAA